MALETGNFISDLVVTNPIGSDPIAFADDHLRLIKKTIKNTFPNINGAVTVTQTALNNIPANTSAAIVEVQSNLDAAVAAYQATQIIAGDGLTGGGDLSANRTLSIPAAGVTGGMLASGAAVANIGFTPADLAAFTGSNQSLTGNGYQKLPGGLILQWGTTADIPKMETRTITFPLAFPNACLNVQATRVSTSQFSGDKRDSYAAHGYTKTTFQMYNQYETETCSYAWFAIGY